MEQNKANTLILKVQPPSGLRYTQYTSNNKQIMTGLEGNRQIYLPREIQDRLPRVSIDQCAAGVNRNSWGGNPESQGKRISSSMGMITKNTCFLKNFNSESVY